MERTLSRVALPSGNALASPAFQGSLYRRKQLVLGGPLGEEIFCAMPHGPHGSRNVTVTREEDDRHRAAGFRQSVLQVEPALTRHAQIGNDAPCRVGSKLVQKPRCGCKRLDLVAGSSQKSRHGSEKRGVVIHEVNDA